MKDAREIISLLVLASLGTALIVRLDMTTKFVDAVFKDFNGLARTISGQLGHGSVST